MPLGPSLPPLPPPASPPPLLLTPCLPFVLDQPWQDPLPAAPAKLADFHAVTHALRQQLATASPNPAVATKDSHPVTSPTASAFATLAWHCASTFRQSDYRGGCNGACLRFSPEKDWEVNKGLDAVLAALQPIKDQFGEGLSWADLIVLAGGVGLEQVGLSHPVLASLLFFRKRGWIALIKMNGWMDEQAGAKKVAFCPGRTDVKDGQGSANLQVRVLTPAGGMY